MNQIDWFSEISTISAVIATGAACFAIAFELRSRRRKIERDRIVALIKERMPDRDNISDVALADIEAFISARLSQPVLRHKLTKDLQDLALLAIIDDRIIFQTTKNVRDQLQRRGLSPDDRKRWVDFVIHWLKSNDQAALPLPERSDEARKNAEYNKKKKMLGAELEKVIA